MRLYLDCCCYNRPFDDLSQSRVSYESKAILSIIDEAIQTGVIILGSSILNSEIDNIKDLNKQFKIWALYQAASVFIPLSEEIVELAEKIRSKTSIHFNDSLHLASAEFGNADFFFTTDDKLIKACQKINLNVHVINPLVYYMEMMKNEN